MNPDYLNNFEPAQHSTGSQFIELLQTFVIFAAVFLVIFLFVAQPHKVSGPSMKNTFHNDDYIITDKLTYRFSNPQRGNVIVFQAPRDHSTDFIKRIIGLPGDKVKIEAGKVYINDKLLNEPYLMPGIQTFANQGFIAEGETKTVPQNEYFALGDNRVQSSDSRDWGYIKRNEILGRVLVRYWPANYLGVFPGTYSAYGV